MIKRAETRDAGALASLAAQMWTEHAPDELAAEFRELIQNEDAACFLKYAGDRPVAFAQCQLRHGRRNELRMAEEKLDNSA